MSWSYISSPIENNSLLWEALREKDLEIQRQRHLVQKLRKDRELLNADLLQEKLKCEEMGLELKRCKAKLKKMTDIFNEPRPVESNNNDTLDVQNEVKMYKQCVKELVQRNEKQDELLKKLIKENKSLRKGGENLPHVRVSQLRLTTQRNSLT